MTDFTTDTVRLGHRVRHVPPRGEYHVYFAIIFLATLPLALLTWALTALRQMAVPEKGPVARALTQARIITPLIFSA